MPLLRLCHTQEIPPGQAKAFQIKGRKVAVFHRPDGFFALDDHCPHRSGPMSEGWIDNEEVVCPWHQWSFSLRTGLCSNIPGSSLKVFPLTLQEDQLFVTVD